MASLGRRPSVQRVSVSDVVSENSIPSPSVEVKDEADSFSAGEGEENFKVVIRVRPPLDRERYARRGYEPTVWVDPSGHSLVLSENLKSLPDDPAAPSIENGLVFSTYRYTFDNVYNAEAQQQQVYDITAREAVLSTLQGYNAAVIAYGQTGTGKTYTMEGAREGPDQGIIPRAIEDIFMHIESDSAAHSKYLVRASHLQIYNEVISDLLKPERTNLVIREDRKRGVYVEGLSEWVVRNPDEVHTLMEAGALQRTTGVTKMNETSSRSHAVFTVIIEKSSVPESAQGSESEDLAQLCGFGGRTGGSSVQAARPSIRAGKLNLVDLAGSERVHITGATGKRLEESKKINASLSALGNVISALTDTRGSRQHIPYRDSRLTRFLEDSLGGNCKTTIIATISPALEAFSESLSTLKFANRAKRIRNLVRVNVDLDQRTLLRKYERELRRLRSELQQRQVDLVDKRHLLALEEQKRRAEADKLAAINALEARSREIVAEKEAKRRLEQRIQGLQSQLLLGGHKLEDTPVFRKMLAKEQQRIRAEYEARFKELERERQGTPAGKAQVERYTQLLLKQREVMLALTARLKRRDDQILNLQQELETFDQHQQQLEDDLDQRTAELIAVRRAAVDPTAPAAPRQPTQSEQASEEAGPRGPVELVDFEDTRKMTVSQEIQLMGSRASASDKTPSTAASVSSAMAREHTNRMQASQELQERLATQQREVSRLQSENSSLMAQLTLRGADSERLPQGPDGTTALAALQEQCDSHAKERRALKTILDAKVGSIVRDLGLTLQTLPHEELEGDAGQRMQHQVAALQRLVSATVSAMSSSAKK